MMKHVLKCMTVHAAQMEKKERSEATLQSDFIISNFKVD